jgi:hypothetical protein
MKHLSTLLILFLVFSAFGQSETAGKVNVTYDRFKDITTVNTLPIDLFGAEEYSKWGVIFFQIFGQYEVKGSVGQLPDTVKVAFSSVSKKPFFASANDRTLNLIIDGKRIAYGEMKYSGLKSHGTTNYEESVWMELSTADFKNFLKSKSVELQMGKLEFNLPSSILNSLSLLIQESKSDNIPLVSSNRNYIFKTTPDALAPQKDSVGKPSIKNLDDIVGNWEFKEEVSKDILNLVIVKVNNDYFIGVKGQNNDSTLDPL